MTTTAQQIIDAALAKNLANDAGTTDLASNTTELLAVISRAVQQVYALAAVPQQDGGTGRTGYFTRSTTVTVGTPNTTFVALPAAAYVPTFTDSLGRVVATVTMEELREGRAEYPPAIVIRDGKFASAARTGDPSAGSTLTVDYAYLPAVLTAATNYIGATTLTDSTTSNWPSFVGDEFLICDLALYLAIKDGMRDPQEIEALKGQRSAALDSLGRVLKLGPTQLARLKAA